jgi:hypothetical protein
LRLRTLLRIRVIANQVQLDRFPYLCDV